LILKVAVYKNFELKSELNKVQNLN